MSLGKKLAQRVLSLSRVLEAEGIRAQARSNLLDSLDEFATLAESVRQSLEPPPAPETVTAPAPAPEKPAAPAQPARPSQYTAKQEYRAALGNQGLVDALLEYHQKTRKSSSKILRPGESTGFVSAKIPEVEAELKDERRLSRSPLAFPILRSR